jgi:hypothetical protein
VNESTLAFARELLGIVLSKPYENLAILAGIVSPLFLNLKNRFYKNFLLVCLSIAMPLFQIALTETWLQSYDRDWQVALGPAMQVMAASVFIIAIGVYLVVILATKHFLERNSALRIADSVHPSILQNKITRDN